MHHTPADPQQPPVSQPGDALTWADTARGRAFDSWLADVASAHELDAASVRVASADASFRRYFRVLDATGQSRVIMDAPPDKEDCAAFVKVASLMQGGHIAAPQVLAWDQAQGFMLLTDLGHHTLLDVLSHIPGLQSAFDIAAHPHAGATATYITEADKSASLRQAHALVRSYMGQSLDMLVQWQQATAPQQLPPYDHALLLRELKLFEQWYVAQHKGFALSESQQRMLDATFETIIATNLDAPQVYVHRDFMPRNIMVASDNSLGLLDFQDAVMGPITYDIASLMRDAFWSWDDDMVIDITVRYWERARAAGLLNHNDWDQDFGAFFRAVEWMGLQRHLKILGIFARLTLRDGKPKYLADTPRFVHYVRNTASRYRELKPLLHLIDEIEGLQVASGYSFGPA
jgi:N-acetylmuramate 1-kinase